MSNRGIIAGTPPFGGVALIDPARNPLIENPEIAISLDVQLFVGQTGQLVGTRSVEDDQAVAWDFPGLDIDPVDGNR
jgi:hypothetical protein